MFHRILTNPIVTIGVLRIVSVSKRRKRTLLSGPKGGMDHTAKGRKVPYHGDAPDYSEKLASLSEALGLVV